MAKKPQVVVERPPVRQLIRLDLEPSSHQEVRLAAARSGLSMAEFSRQAVTAAARKVNAAK